MRKFILLIFLVLLVSFNVNAKTKLSGYVHKGVQTIKLGVLTFKVPYSYPSSTVTVYKTGTTTLATIYSDNDGTLKSNPFTATSDAYWEFWADNGIYDIKFSGTGITTPFTFSRYIANDPTTFYYDVTNFGCTNNNLIDSDTQCLKDVISAAGNGSHIKLPQKVIYAITEPIDFGSKRSIIFEGLNTIPYIGSTDLPQIKWNGVPFSSGTVNGIRAQDSSTMVLLKNAGSCTIRGISFLPAANGQTNKADTVIDIDQDRDNVLYSYGILAGSTQLQYVSSSDGLQPSDYLGRDIDKNRSITINGIGTGGANVTTAISNITNPLTSNAIITLPSAAITTIGIVTKTGSIGSGSNVLNCVNCFTSDVASKPVTITGAGVAGVTLNATIVTFVNNNQVVINTNASTTTTATSTITISPNSLGGTITSPYLNAQTASSNLIENIVVSTAGITSTTPNYNVIRVCYSGNNNCEQETFNNIKAFNATNYVTSYDINYDKYGNVLKTGDETLGTGTNIVHLSFNNVYVYGHSRAIMSTFIDSGEVNSLETNFTPVIMDAKNTKLTFSNFRGETWRQLLLNGQGISILFLNNHFDIGSVGGWQVGFPIVQVQNASELSFYNSGFSDLLSSGAAYQVFDVSGVTATSYITLDESSLVVNEETFLASINCVTNPIKYNHGRLTGPCNYGRSYGLNFAQLGTPVVGSYIYCRNCSETDPCTGGGNGAFAKRVGSPARWKCN